MKYECMCVTHMNTCRHSKFAAKHKHICSKGLTTVSKLPEQLIMPLLLGTSIFHHIALISYSSCLLHALFHLWCWEQIFKEMQSPSTGPAM